MLLTENPGPLEEKAGGPVAHSHSPVVGRSRARGAQLQLASLVWGTGKPLLTSEMRSVRMGQGGDPRPDAAAPSPALGKEDSVWFKGRLTN